MATVPCKLLLGEWFQRDMEQSVVLLLLLLQFQEENEQVSFVLGPQRVREKRKTKYQLHCSHDGV